MSLPKRKLKEIVTGIFDCPHSTPKWTSSGVLVIRNFNVKNGKLVLDKPSFTDEGTFIGRTRRAVPSAGDLILTREAPMGEICMVPINMKCCLGQRVVLIRPDSNKVYPPYLLYAFLSDQIQHQIRMSEGTGSVVSNLRIPHIEDLEFVLPDYKIQKQIASILSSIDDKIELNRCMNQTLERIAATLFKKYFVDGIGSENLPEGWRDGKLNEILSFRNGKSSPLRNEDGSNAVYGSNGIIGFCDQSNAEAKSIIIGRVGSFCGSLYFSLNNCYVTDNAIIAEVLIDDSSAFSYLLLQSLNLNNFKGGSGQPLINQTVLSSIDIIIPPFKTVQEFERTALSLYQQIFHNEQENFTLSKTRDSLLPKLMSGEIDLSTINENEELHAGVLS